MYKKKMTLTSFGGPETIILGDMSHLRHEVGGEDAEGVVLGGALAVGALELEVVGEVGVEGSLVVEGSLIHTFHGEEERVLLPFVAGVEQPACWLKCTNQQLVNSNFCIIKIYWTKFNFLLNVILNLMKIKTSNRSLP